MSLTVTDFQKISNGTYNAGDITLTKSGKLDKVNNHVGILKGWNTKTVSASKTLEVKNAFVEALRNAGVNDDELAKVRKDLGLPEGGGTKGLDLSTLKPLTRAQTRVILDSYKDTINGTLNRTVVSNRWEAHKAANDQNYINHFNVADRTNLKTVADRAAAQEALGRKIMAGGVGSLPKGVRNSPDFAGLSASDKSRFAYILASLLIKGGADVDGLAAEAMKRLLVSNYIRDLANDAEKNLFKSLVGGMSATTDLSLIKADVEAAKKAAAGAKFEAGAKLEFKSTSAEMDKVTFDFACSDVYRKITEMKFAPNETANGIGEVLSEKENLNKIVSCFGAQVNKYGTLEVVGEPSYELKTLKNGNTMLEFSFDAGIGGDNKTVGGRCTLRLEIDDGGKPPIRSSVAEMKLEPRLKFTDRDLNPEPAEYHTRRIIENVKSAAVKRNAVLGEDNIAALEEQMADWGNLEPGQMKNIEAWILDELSTGGTLEYDNQGFCTQLYLDSNRAQFTVNGKTFHAGANPQASSNDNLKGEILEVLPDDADRKLITGLMNQATFYNVQFLITNQPDPAHNGEDDAPLMRNRDPAGRHIANYNPPGSVVRIVASDEKDSVRYDLKVDKEKNTATLIATSDHNLSLSDDDKFWSLAKNGSGMKLGKASYSLDIKITGLNSGSPKIVSVGFSQHITALDA